MRPPTVLEVPGRARRREHVPAPGMHELRGVEVPTRLAHPLRAPVHRMVVGTREQPEAELGKIPRHAGRRHEAPVVLPFSARPRRARTSRIDVSRLPNAAPAWRSSSTTPANASSRSRSGARGRGLMQSPTAASVKPGPRSPPALVPRGGVDRRRDPCRRACGSSVLRCRGRLLWRIEADRDPEILSISEEQSNECRGGARRDAPSPGRPARCLEPPLGSWTGWPGGGPRSPTEPHRWRSSHGEVGRRDEGSRGPGTRGEAPARPARTEWRARAMSVTSGQRSPLRECDRGITCAPSRHLPPLIEKSALPTGQQRTCSMRCRSST